MAWPLEERQQEQGPRFDPVARKEASVQEVRGYYKQFAEATHHEHKSWVDKEVFDLVDMRKVKPRNYVSERWVLTIETDKQTNFFKGKNQIGIKRVPGQAEGLPTNFFHKTWISDELPNGSQQELEHFSH